MAWPKMGGSTRRTRCVLGKSDDLYHFEFIGPRTSSGAWGRSRCLQARLKGEIPIPLAASAICQRDDGKRPSRSEADSGCFSALDKLRASDALVFIAPPPL